MEPELKRIKTDNYISTSALPPIHLVSEEKTSKMMSETQQATLQVVEKSQIDILGKGGMPAPTEDSALANAPFKEALAFNRHLGQ